MQSQITPYLTVFHMTLLEGLRSAVLGAVAYSVISAVFIRVLGLANVGVIRAAVGG